MEMVIVPNTELLFMRPQLTLFVAPQNVIFECVVWAVKTQIVTASRQTATETTPFSFYYFT